MITNWFLVTSAIMVEYGIFSVEQRFTQTLDTIKSIRKYCPNSKVIILESSPILLHLNYKKQLLSEVDLLIDFSSDDIILNMHKELPLNAIKSPCEVYILKQFLTSETFIKPTDRIYKISGRYCLHSVFDYNEHVFNRERIVIGTKFPGIIYYNRDTNEQYEMQSEWQYKTRLYSFCGSLKQYMIDVYDKIIDYFLEIYGKTFTDLEHALYKFLNKDLVIEIPYVGVTGIFADRKELVVE